MSDIAKIIYRVTIDGTEIGKRTSAPNSVHSYTHALVWVNLDGKRKVISYHSRADLAQAAKQTRASQTLGGSLYYKGHGLVVPVTREVKLRKRTAPADANAAARGVISRRIGAWRKSINRSTEHLAEMQGNNWVACLGYWAKGKTPEQLAESRAVIIARIEASIAECETYIAELEGERAALLAAQVEG